jgi:hypothetical protein
MQIARFDAPGRNGDFAGNAALAARWSARMSNNFDQAVADVTGSLTATGGTPQFYNPVTNGSTAPDAAPPAGKITWNGFPRKFLGSGPGVQPNFAGAEPALAAGAPRPQDEYLEWFVTRAAGKITQVVFTCEGWDYYEFLGAEAPDILVRLYQTFVNPAIVRADLFTGTRYNRLNRFNTSEGAMHLTERANNLFAEVFLAAQSTVRRRRGTVEVTGGAPLCTCGGLGDPRRNSDPTIAAAVNGLARQRRRITLADPVGLYIDKLDMASFRLPNGSRLPATWFRVLRGAAGFTLRAVFAPPPGSPLTVSDIRIGGTPIQFGGQIAQNITMRISGVASVAQTINNQRIPCIGAEESPGGAAAAPSPEFPRRHGG